MSDTAIVQNEPVQRLGGKVVAKVQELLSIDTRSLALFRMLLATTVLIDLIHRVGDLQAHYTDFGVLPTWAARHVLSYGPMHWSLHLISGNGWWQGFLFVVAGVAAIAMLAGYKTRWATIISWVLLASLHTRHPLILNGGDNLLRMLLFWSMFLPTGLRFSLDRYLSRDTATPKSAPKMVFSAASVAILLQLLLMYYVAVVTKTDEHWVNNRWALYFALNLDHITTGFAKWLAGFPELTRWLTVSSLYLEWWGPILLFVPVYTARIRTVIIFLFVGLHVGMDLCFQIGLFPWTCIVGWIPFLPGAVWDWCNKRYRALKNLSPKPQFPDGSEMAPAIARSSLLVNIVVSVLFAWVVIGNFQVSYKTIFPAHYQRLEAAYPAQFKLFNQCWKTVGDALWLEQHFDLFAPRVTPVDGWFVAVATLDDGSEVDLMENGAPVHWEKPEMLSARASCNGHWGAYLFFLKSPEQTATRFRPFFVDYLKRDWLERPGEERKIQKVELYMMLEKTPPYPQLPKPEKILLYRDRPGYEVGDYFSRTNIK